MMNKETSIKLGIIILLLLVYPTIINFISEINIDSSSYINESGEIVYGMNEKISFGDSVSVSITRNRWYGTIYELVERSDVHLFNLVNLPLKSENFDYRFIHLIFVIFLGFLFLYGIPKKTKSI